MTKFRLFNFGCRTSQAEGAALKRELLQAGLVEADGIEHANVAVLNTCTVTAPKLFALLDSTTSASLSASTVN